MYAAIVSGLGRSVAASASQFPSRVSVEVPSDQPVARPAAQSVEQLGSSLIDNAEPGQIVEKPDQDHQVEKQPDQVEVQPDQVEKQPDQVEVEKQPDQVEKQPDQVEVEKQPDQVAATKVPLVVAELTTGTGKTVMLRALAVLLSRQLP